MDVNSAPPPHQKTREEMLAWIELGTAFVSLRIVLFSLFQALRRDVNSAPPPHQKTREEMLAWIELGTDFVSLGIVLFSLFQALRSCSSNNNDAPPEVDGGAPV
uniref:Uncharacterized protein n=1 Tax=Fagus sylvatica TaxID=28930 RepID=A0A2N9IE68_FAGSY